MGSSASVAGKVTTIPCMVDRICTGRTIEEHGVNVEAEPDFDGALVLLDPPADPSLVPFAGENVVSEFRGKAKKEMKRLSKTMMVGVRTWAADE